MGRPLATENVPVGSSDILPEKYDFNEYRIIGKFIARVVIPKQSEMLAQSIHGKGAFRRFKTVLERLGW